MQPSYDFSGLLCFCKTNTNLHSHSVPALYLTTRAKARVGGNSCGQTLLLVAQAKNSKSHKGVARCPRRRSEASFGRFVVAGCCLLHLSMLQSVVLFPR